MPSLRGVDLCDRQRFGWDVVPERLGRWSAWALFFQPARSASVQASAAWLKVDPALLAAWRVSMGSSPLARRLRCSSAAARASQRLTT